MNNISNNKTLFYCNYTVPKKFEPVGDMTLCASDTGICAVAWSTRTWERFLSDAHKTPNIDLVEEHQKLEHLIKELSEYFSGKRRVFTVEFDLFTRTKFEQQALLNAFKIPFGQTATYGNIAAACGIPGGARAVGNAMNKNPVPIVIPCHRVVRSGGHIGGFGGGLDRKVLLLEHEGVFEYTGNEELFETL
ncbi:methylated-DNA--[protein]-cysteine S-methyltransferase [candidate division KSB1 bacterium]